LDRSPAKWHFRCVEACFHLKYLLSQGGGITLTLYWELKRHIYKDPKTLAIALADPFKRFPNFHSNADEMRELKAQLYKLLLPSVQGKKMVEVAERLIKVRTP
jgi:hypothetical protein